MQSSVSDSQHLIENDLRALCVEARRDYVVVKDAAERAVLRLRQLRAAPPAAAGAAGASPTPGDAAAAARAALQSEDFLRPYLLACNHTGASKRLLLCAIGSIQRLITMDAVSPKEPANIMRVLTLQVDNSENEIRLKILQTLPLLLANSAYEMPVPLQAQALAICLRMHADKEGVIHHTAGATLRQVMELLFERAEAEAFEGTRHDDPEDTTGVVALTADNLKEHACAHGAHLFTRDLCTMGHGEDGEWLRGCSISRELALELLEGALSSHSRLFSQSAPFVALVREHVSPLLIKTLRSESSFPVLLRLLRTVVVVITELGSALETEAEIFLHMLVRFVEVCEGGFEAEARRDEGREDRLGRSGASIVARAHKLLAEQQHKADVEAAAARGADGVLVGASRRGGAHASLGLGGIGGAGYMEDGSPLPLFQEVIVLEALHMITLKSETLRAIFKQYDDAPGATALFRQLVTALSGFLQRVLTNSAEGGSAAARGSAPSGPSEEFCSEAVDRASVSHARRPLQSLELADAEPAGLSAASLPLLAVECMVNIADALGEESHLLHSHFAAKAHRKASEQRDRQVSPSRRRRLSKGGSEAGDDSAGAAADAALSAVAEGDSGSPQHPGPLPAGASSPSAVDESQVDALNEGRTLAVKMVGSSWREIVGSFELILGHCTQENLVQFLLKACESFANTCGKLGLDEPRDAILTMLCRFALPSAQAGRMTQRHIMVLKTLFNIAHCLGGILGGSWLFLLETFQEFDKQMSRQRKRGAAEGSRSRMAGLGADSLKRSLGSESTGSNTSARTSSGAGGGRIAQVRDALSRQSRAWSRTRTHSGAADYALAVDAALDDISSDTARLESPGMSGGSGGAWAPEDELEILSSMLSSLFESSRHLGDDAIMQLLTSLGHLALSSLADAATAHLEVEEDPVETEVGSDGELTERGIGSLRSASPDGDEAVLASLPPKPEEVGADGQRIHPGTVQRIGSALSGLGSVAAASAAYIADSVTDLVAAETGNDGSPIAAMDTAVIPAEAPYRAPSRSPDVTAAGSRVSLTHQGGAGLALAPQPSRPSGKHAKRTKRKKAAKAKALSKDGTIESLSSEFLRESAPGDPDYSGDGTRGAAKDALPPPRGRGSSLTVGSGAAKDTTNPDGASTPASLLSASSSGHALGGPVVVASADAPAPAPKARTTSLSSTGGGGGGSGRLGQLGSDEPPPFALLKLIETTRHNVSRLSLIWETVSAHLQVVSRNPSAPVRAAGLSAIVDIAVDVLLDRHSADGKDEGDTDAAVSPSQIELLSPLLEYWRSPYGDTRAAVLTATVRLLEEAGHLLRGEPDGGWGIVLQLLSAAAASGRKKASAVHVLAFNERREAARRGATAAPSPVALPRDRHSRVAAAAASTLVPIGFKGMRLICDEFLAYLPGSYWSGAIACLGLYSQQEADVNISLTSIGTLWAVADFLGHNAAQASSDLPRSGVAMSDDQMEAIWHDLFGQLRELCCIANPEARNSAVQTLSNTLASHGDKLSASMWREAMFGCLFHVLDFVSLAAESTAQDDTVLEGQRLGHGRHGEAVRMVVHHSRNTAHKQWNESRVLALQGTSRTVYAFFPMLAAQPWLPVAWRHFVSFLLACLTGDAVPIPPMNDASIGSAEGDAVDSAGDIGSTAPPSRAVSLAATAAFDEIGSLVCLPRGGQTTRTQKYGIGMRVIDGALVQVEDDAGIAPGPARDAERGLVEMSRDLRDRLWAIVWEALRSAALSNSVAGAEDDDLLNAVLGSVKSLMLYGTSAVDLEERVPTPDDGNGANCLLNSDRGPVVIRLLQEVAFARRKRLWCAAVDSALEKAAERTANELIEHLGAPRSHALTISDRTLLSMAELAADILGRDIPSREPDADVHDAWVGLLRALLHLGCHNEADFVRAAVDEHAGAELPRRPLALPVPAISCAALALFSKLYATKAPAAVRAVLFNSANAMILDMLQRCLEVLAVTDAVSGHPGGAANTASVGLCLDTLVSEVLKSSPEDSGEPAVEVPRLRRGSSDVSFADAFGAFGGLLPPSTWGFRVNEPDASGDKDADAVDSPTFKVVDAAVLGREANRASVASDLTIGALVDVVHRGLGAVAELGDDVDGDAGLGELSSQVWNSLLDTLEGIVGFAPATHSLSGPLMLPTSVPTADGEGRPYRYDDDAELQQTLRVLIEESSGSAGGGATALLASGDPQVDALYKSLGWSSSFEGSVRTSAPDRVQSTIQALDPGSRGGYLATDGSFSAGQRAEQPEAYVMDAVVSAMCSVLARGNMPDSVVERFLSVCSAGALALVCPGAGDMLTTDDTLQRRRRCFGRACLRHMAGFAGGLGLDAGSAAARSLARLALPPLSNCVTLLLRQYAAVDRYVSLNAGDVGASDSTSPLRRASGSVPMLELSQFVQDASAVHRATRATHGTHGTGGAGGAGQSAGAKVDAAPRVPLSMTLDVGYVLAMLLKLEPPAVPADVVLTPALATAIRADDDGCVRDAHLVALLPALSDAVTSEHAFVREALRELLLRATEALGLLMS